MDDQAHKYINDRISKSMFSRHAVNTDARPVKYYYYRTLSDFWKIINSDELWARNIKYSNDSEEQKLGQTICNQIVQQSDECDEEEYYMLCFTGDNDSLSQWRGYASYGGVAIGFEFNAMELFHIKSKNQDAESDRKTVVTIEATADALVESAQSVDEIDKEYVFIRPYHVIYAKNDDCDDGYGKIVGWLGSKEESGEQSIVPNDLIPYIKHNGFKEENEWRIIINTTMDNCDIVDGVHFQYSEDDNLNIPYLILQPGFDSRKEKDMSFIRMQVNDEGTLVEQIRNDMNLIQIYQGGGRNINDYIIVCNEQKAFKDHCVFCTAVAEDVGKTIEGKIKTIGGMKREDLCQCGGRGRGTGYYLPNGNQIILSQGKKQKEIFNRIYEIIAEHNKKTKNQKAKVKIWCEGHLPIREVVIGPCRNMEDVKSSIENYFKNSDKYWLRCVDVVPSELPYRAPQNRK